MLHMYFTSVWYILKFFCSASALELELSVVLQSGLRHGPVLLFLCPITSHIPLRTVFQEFHADSAGMIQALKVIQKVFATIDSGHMMKPLFSRSFISHVFPTS
jgi:hypothetical protein